MGKLHKDTRGLAHVGLVVLVVAVLAGIGGVGYYVWSKQKKPARTGTSANQSVSNKAVEDECNKILKDKDFCKFASNWTGLANYKSTITTANKEGTSVLSLEAESSTKSKMTTTLNGNENSAFVTIGGSTYVKDYADGKWTKYTSNAPKSENIKDDIKVDFKDDPATPEKEDQTQYKKIGKEACGKQTCFKYQVIDPSTPDVEQFVWFDDQDYLLRQWSSKDKDGTTVMAISYDKVTVTEPSPVKDAPKLEGMSQAEIQAQIDAAAQAAGGANTTDQE